MTDSRKNFTAVKTLSASAPRVWALLTDFSCDAIYRDGMRAALSPVEPDGFDGMLSIDGTAFDAAYTPYDIRLTAANIRLGLRLQPAPSGCTAMLVASVDEDAPMQVSEAGLHRFLDKLELLLTDSLNLKQAPTSPPLPDDGPTSVYVKKPKRRRTGRIAAAAMLILALTAGAVFALTRGSRGGKQEYVPTQTTEIDGGSSTVTMDTALTLTAGMSKSEIDALLGKPQSTHGDTALYVSRLPNAYGEAAVQVQVIYQNKVAQRISALDLTAASCVGAVTGEALPAVADPAALAESAGCGVSLYRSCLENEAAVSEYHFGYLDPKANFSALWQGELWARVAADGSVQTGKGYRYNGSDPLFCSELQGHPFSMQYASFDDYLSDFAVYNLCMEVMEIHYSRGDLNAVLGGMTDLSQFDDITLYQASMGTLEDGSTPAWSFTAGVNTRGEFALLSAINMRLWQQPTALADRDLTSIGMGTGYNDLMQTVGMMPTAIYIDRSYLLLGFGRFLPENSSQTEQFELMVQLQQSDLTVTDVYINTDMQLVIN